MIANEKDLKFNTFDDNGDLLPHDGGMERSKVRRGMGMRYAVLDSLLRSWPGMAGPG